jgi:hypothetical protein
MKLIINCETGKETSKELSAADIAQQAIDEAEAAKEKVITDPFELARIAAKRSAEEKLATLGLTAEEAQLIIGGSN